MSKHKILDLKNNLNVINKNLSAKTCCFTGYRPQKCPWGFNEKDDRCKNMKKTAKKEIEKAIKSGYQNFITDMALGFDMICAEIVLKLKNRYPNIKLIGALPCGEQDKLWNKEQQNRYRQIIKNLDETRCIYKNYIGVSCIFERNHYMISNSSLVIALFDGKLGGTSRTLKDAKKQGLDIVIINP